LDQSILLGKKLQDNFTSGLNRKDRKVKQAGFIVLHQTFMPSVLIEAGFLTNKNEGSYLNSKKGQNEMGKAIADAVLAYKEEMGFVSTPVANQPKPEAPKTIEKETTKIEDTEVAVNIPETTSKEVKTPETPPVKEQPKATEPVKPEPNNTGVVFKVQLMATVKTIPLTGENFNGLDVLSKEAYKNMYRYMYGSAGTYAEAKALKQKADAAGYTTSYIVAYKNGVRVPIKDALK